MMREIANPVWDRDLIQKYDLSGPRYTSYPTALQFSEQFDSSILTDSAPGEEHGSKSLSLYIHIPFCAHLCYYCGCNKIVTRKEGVASDYLSKLFREIDQQAKIVGRNSIVEQLHLGGGTPTFLSEDEIHDLMAELRARFSFLRRDLGDFSIEIDPRECTPLKLHLLRYEGYNRLSLGVQDFDPGVQKAVNRLQPVELVENLVKTARNMEFESINLDLIYGLPLQTPESFQRTIQRVIDLDPDRLSIFNYAHIPERFMSQRRIRGEDLPSPAEKLNMLKLTIEQLTRAGYVYIGMDHFAKPTDPLAKAQQSGNLHRNFQGYTTHKHCDLIAMGVSSISQVGDCIYQNHVDLQDYIAAIDNCDSTVAKGLKLNRDDRIRRDVIMQLICHFYLDKARVEAEHKIVFHDYFDAEIKQLKQLEKDGLLVDSPSSILVTPQGRLLVRAICMVFDAYLDDPSTKQRFSRVI